MAPPAKRPSAEDASFCRLSFTKTQVGLLVTGLAALVTLSFSVGYLFGENEGERRIMGMLGGQVPARGRAMGPAIGSATPETTVSLKARRGEGEDAGRKSRVQLDFYKKLLEKEPKRTPKLPPLPLPGQRGGGKGPPPRAANARKAAAPPAEKREPAPPPRARKAVPEQVRRPSPARGYSIQVAAVRRRERAESVRRELERVGYSAVIDETVVRGQGVWYRVRVGQFSDKRSARRVLVEIEARTSLRGGRIVAL